MHDVIYIQILLCSLIGLSEEVCADLHAMKDIAIHTRIGPADRVRSLKKLIETVNSWVSSKLSHFVYVLWYWNTFCNTSKFSKSHWSYWVVRSTEATQELKNWNLKFASQLLTMQSRQLPSEKIFQATESYNYARDWSKEMRGQTLINPSSLINWVMIFSQRDAGNAINLYQALLKVCPSMGVRMTNSTMYVLI